MINMSENPINVFVVYSRDDSDLLTNLRKHLSQISKTRNLNIQYDGVINPGQAWEVQINEFLEKAHIVVLLVSSNFLSSEYVNSKELPKALERLSSNEFIVIPVLARACHGWHLVFSIGQLQILPKNAKAITSWPNQDEAYSEVAKGIDEAAQRLISKIYKPDDLKASGNEDSPEFNEEYFYYKAFFYTYRKHETREIDFALEITSKGILANVSGLHFIEETGEKTGEKYYGYAEEVGSRLFFNLDIKYQKDYIGSKEQTKLQIILHLGEMSLKRQIMIVGTAQWISSYGYPVSAEILLYRTQSSEDIVPFDDLDKIKRYMMFKRSMRRIPDRIVSKTGDLRIKNNRLDQLSDIQGVYRVWTYYREGIIQSRLTIFENYNAKFETKTYGRESGDSQVCLLNISTIQGRQRICMSHHPPLGTEILAYSIIDIPLEDQGLTKGVFCSMGRQGAEHQHCGWLVLKKEQMATDFEVSIYSSDKIKFLVQTNPSLKDMLKLFNLHSENKLKFEGRRKR